MPPKKRDKESEISSKIMMGRVDQAADNEMFLQAFEKPTQIYRYIANRHVTNPLYLNRTLTYMKHRMSRGHKKRDTFKIDNMLQLKQNKIRMDKASIFGDFITFKFLGFYDKNNDTSTNNNIDDNNTTTTNNNDKIVRVETILLKISHKKRKDSSSDLVQDSMGAIDVRVNPSDINDNAKCPTINIPTESFMPLSENQNKSFLIFFKVETISKISNILDENCDEPSSKRQKPNTKFYGSEMIIFDKHSRCVLTVGEYDVALQEIIPSTKNSPKKLINWETIPMDSGIAELIDRNDNPFDIFTKCPSLKFNLEWTNKSGEPVIDTINNLKIEQNIEQQQHQQELLNYIGKPINNNDNNNLINIKNKKTDLDVLRNHNNNSIVQSSTVLNNNNNGIIGKKELDHQQLQQQQKSMEEEKVKIVYNFMYNNNSRQQTEYSQLSICPWCRINCRKLYALLKHLKLCHPRFNFTYVPINDAARIDVTINDMYDGSYAGSPNDLVRPSGATFARTSGRVRRTVVTNLLVCRPRRQKASLSEFLELDENEINNQRPYITGHNRLYHHTETCLPVHPKELDIDSEGESDPLWLQHKTMQMIDEFTDVNEGEKELMKMWNLHVMRHGYVGDCQLSIACDMFLEIRGRELIQKNLYRNFVLHMCSLFDYGLVSPETVQKTIQKLQGILSTYQDGKKIITQSRESQLNYWLNFGIHKQAIQDEQKLKSPIKQPNNNDINHILVNKSLNNISSSSTSSNINNSIAIVALPKNTQLLKSNSNNNNNGETSKKFAAALCAINNTTDNNKNKSLNDKLKVTITNKIINGNRSNSNNSTTTTNIVNRKRSMSTLQQTDNSTIGVSGQQHSNKRRLSQLRESSPPRRRSTPTTTTTTATNNTNNNNKQKNQKNRRQSVAVFNTTQIASVTASSNQIAMRKRLSIPLTKAEKH